MLIDEIERLIHQYAEFYRQGGGTGAFPDEELAGWRDHFAWRRQQLLTMSDEAFEANEAAIRRDLAQLDYDIRSYYYDTGELGDRP